MRSVNRLVRQRAAHRRLGLVFAAALVAFGLPALLTGCFAKTPPKPASPTAAVVEGRTITIEELDGEIKSQLFAERFPASREVVIYEARRKTLDEMVDAIVLDRAAQGSGLDADAWLEAEVARRDPVTEEEIDAFWKQFESRIPKDRPEDEIRSDIRAYLTEEHGKSIVAELRDSAKVRITLARPRHDVVATGTPRGPEDAPITIVEFSDFECPFCLRASGVVQEVLERYPEQVRFYYRHLPLPNHSRARAAAIASVCAERQGQFWAYHDQLFADQHAMSGEHLRTRAEALQLDLDSFEACLASPDAAARVDADIAAADALGVSGTPVFFVNGIRLTGAQPLESFVRVIDEELAAQSAE